MLLCAEVSRDRSIRLGVAFEILGILCSCALKYPEILASVLEKFIFYRVCANVRIYFSLKKRFCK